MTVLAVSDLRKSFGGVAAVAGVSFAVAAGELLPLIGPNGAGKSTCFNMVGGQLRPDAGSVRLAEREVAGLPPRLICRAGVGRTFQITATFASMTVRENVQVALMAHRRETGRWWRRAARCDVPGAEALLEQVGLANGDLKRLELAIVLAAAPRLLLMDEPTAGMAPRERVALMQVVRRIATGRGLAVLFTEHDMDVVFGVADRIAVLARGALIAAGDGAAIRADPQVRAIYLGTGGH
jgi:branched-chain amino acid transport system ATP-binding protein